LIVGEGSSSMVAREELEAMLVELIVAFDNGRAFDNGGACDDDDVRALEVAIKLFAGTFFLVT